MKNVLVGTMLVVGLFVLILAPTVFDANEESVTTEPREDSIAVQDIQTETHNLSESELTDTPHVSAPAATLSIAPTPPIVSTTETTALTKSVEPIKTTSNTEITDEAVSTVPTRSFSEPFTTPFTVAEAASLAESSHLNWWVSSGGYLFSENGIGRTIRGGLSPSDERYQNYQATNPADTDRGLHPQNIFRLVQTDTWQNSSQRVAFKITDVHYSSSPNRNASNGLLFFVHYQDEFNLYYAGVRVDGQAVIKKKSNGRYYTLDLNPIYGSPADYSRKATRQLIPENTWLYLRSDVRENKDGSVTITLLQDTNGSGNWQPLVEATDDGKSFGGPVFTEGHAGIRTDFMDVQFDDYSITEI